MKRKIVKLTKYALITGIALFILLSAGVGLRLLYVVPQLQPWHTFVPGEFTAAEIDKASWEDYIRRESRLLDEVHREVVLKTPDSQRHPINRYYEGSRVYPPNFKENWNRSYILIPENPKGAVVLLHGLTDAPYNLRHVARLYYQQGFVAVGIRAPGHGTVPAALTKVRWQDWMAAARLAVREATRLAPEGSPLHVVGFSKGGTLAIKYALDALEDDSLSRPDQLILISPMVGIVPISKVAEIMGIPSFLPGFEKAAWVSIIPEFNPFKYNSFPVNAIRQSRLLVTDMNRQIIRLYNNGRIEELPPVIAFQSIVDYTVSTPALINDLYRYIPDNGSELVLFDINRDVKFIPLVRPVFINMLSIMLPDLPQDYRITVIGSDGLGDSSAVERTVPPGGSYFTARNLGLIYPPEVFSLSHISLPFPENDSLYGSSPDPETKNEFGINLGLVSHAQGERGVLEINTNLFFRIASNPLFPYLEERINQIIAETSMPPYARYAQESF
ncbi:MAG: alpha/beta hydrolase [Alphaproteobacteria bacterium]|nr:alpha/beta hydrolase [Alphaproteobacteria bacterium]